MNEDTYEADQKVLIKSRGLPGDYLASGVLGTYIRTGKDAFLPFPHVVEVNGTEYLMSDSEVSAA